MKQNHGCFFMFLALLLVLLACIPILYFIIRDPGSVLTWVSLAVGIGLSLPLYFYIGISMQKNKSKDLDTSQQQKNSGNSAYRWLIPTVVVGLVLGNIIWLFLGETARQVIFIILSGWMAGTFGFAAYLIWRYAD